jgi:hypothetical protein
MPLNNNQKVYFCGFTAGNQGDIMFGQLSSMDLASLTVEIVF